MLINVYVISKEVEYGPSDILGVAESRSDAKRYLINTNPNIKFDKELNCWFSYDGLFRFDIEKHEIISFKNKVIK